MAYSPTRSSSRIISKFSIQVPNLSKVCGGSLFPKSSSAVVRLGGMLLDRGVSLAGELLLPGQWNLELGTWASRIIPSVSVSHDHASSWALAGWWYSVVVWVYWMWRSIRRIIACFGGRTIGGSPEFSLSSVSGTYACPPSQDLLLLCTLIPCPRSRWFNSVEPIIMSDAVLDFGYRIPGKCSANDPFRMSSNAGLRT